VSDEPLPSDPGPQGRAQRKLDARHRRARAEPARPPPDDQLIPVSDGDSHHPLGLSGTHRNQLGWGFTKHYKLHASTADELNVKIERAVQEAGFKVTIASPGRVDFSKGPNGFQVTGVTFAERNLMEDPIATWRKNRIRWAGIGLGLALIAGGVLGVIEYGKGSPVVLLAIVGGVTVFMSGLSMVNRDYWSDAVIIRWLSWTESRVMTHKEIKLSSHVEIAVTVGRGLSQEWRGKDMAGRTLLSLFPSDELTRLEETIGHAVGASPLTD
jgi:hypothetical protein